MADLFWNGLMERDIDQAIIALKKGAYLLKYGRRGKPKFCPFRLSNDETTLIWYSGKNEKQLELNSVSRIIPGQRTANFQRYPRPEKEYQSFSLICNDGSLDLICKDKEEAEVWFTGLRALLSIGPNSRSIHAVFSSANSPVVYTRRNSPVRSPYSSTESLSQESGVDMNRTPHYRAGRVLSDGELHSRHSKGALVSHSKSALVSHSVGGSLHHINFDGGSSNVNMHMRVPSLESVRVSMSSAFSSSSAGSGRDAGDALGDVYMWGEGVGGGYLGGGSHKIGQAIGVKMDALLPKSIDSMVALDAKYVACGGRHAALVTRKGEVFCWGEESGGHLGHGVDAHVSQPHLVDSLTMTNVELVACGEYHTCAVTVSGELYTWGDGTHNFGLLGQGNDVSHWMPRRVSSPLEGLHVSYVSCGPWHTALVTLTGQMFTFGDGAFGALGHGTTMSMPLPREVDSLKGSRSVRVACGVWHTAAVVEVITGGTSSCTSAKLFTWGDGDKGRLGHGDSERRLMPTCVASLVELNFKEVACGHSLTAALTKGGHVFTMGSPVYGQLGNSQADGKVPSRVEGGKLRDTVVEEIACGAFHVAVLTSRSEIYTWGKGANGRLGHGDTEDRSTPTLVEALKGKHVKAVACGCSFTAAICLHRGVSGVDQLMCSGCRVSFGFTRKRHNCYNCGLAFCHPCTPRKALKASLAPNQSKPYRVCDPCFLKLKNEILSTLKMGGRKVIGQLPPLEWKEKQEKTDRKFLRPPSKLEETKSFSRRSRRPMASSSRVSPIRDSSSQWGGVLSSAPSSAHLAFGPSRRAQSASVPHSRIASRATSPISSTRRISPPRAATPAPIFMGLNFPKTIDEDMKKTNEILNKEVVKLRAQVDNMTRCCQLREVELKCLTRELHEAVKMAEEESTKCRASKDVIKSLTEELKDMAERLPGGISRNRRGNGLNGQLLQLEGLDMTRMENIQHSSISTLDSSGTAAEYSTEEAYVVSSTHCVDGVNGSDGHQRIGISVPNNGQEEWVVQDEPGVYITLASLQPHDGNDLKRVRFSRKQFSEKQAELWWQENKGRVHEQYNVHVVEKSTMGLMGPPSAEEEEGVPSTATSLSSSSSRINRASLGNF